MAIMCFYRVTIPFDNSPGAVARALMFQTETLNQASFDWKPVTGNTAAALEDEIKGLAAAAYMDYYPSAYSTVNDAKADTILFHGEMG